MKHNIYNEIIIYKNEGTLKLFIYKIMLPIRCKIELYLGRRKRKKHRKLFLKNYDALWRK